MYQLNIIKSGKNPMTGRAQYRVASCHNSHDLLPKYAIYLKGAGGLYLWLNKPRKVGSYINPTKALFGK